MSQQKEAEIQGKINMEEIRQIEIIQLKKPEIICPDCDTIMEEGNSFFCMFFSATWYNCPKCKKRVEVRS